MADKNYIKALRRAKSKKALYSSFVAFIPIAAILITLNATFIAPYMPWCLIPIFSWAFILAIHKLMLSKKPQRTIFSRDFLEYQTEKELRLIEFEDDMDELEAEKLELKVLDLERMERFHRLDPTENNFQSSGSGLV